jgi:bacterioferritin-associated ferredoxin
VVVCSCRAVSDSVVREAIAAGATSVEDVTAHCAAASRCGGCWPTLERMLTEHSVIKAIADTPVVVAVAAA